MANDMNEGSPKGISRRTALKGFALGGAAAGGLALMEAARRKLSFGGGETKEAVLPQRWEVVTDAGLSAVSEQDRTVEQDLRLVREALLAVPQLGRAKVILTDGDRPSFNADTPSQIPEIRISRKTLPEFMQAQVARESIFGLDPQINYKELPKVLSRDKLATLTELKKKALDDPVFTPNVPSMTDIFSDSKRLSFDPENRGAYNRAQLAQLVTIYPDAIWLMQGPAPDDNKSKDLFEPMMKKTSSVMAEGAEKTQIVKQDSLGGFLEENSAQLAGLAREEPLFGFALDTLNRTKNWYDSNKLANLMWSRGHVRGFSVGGKTEGTWWSGLRYLTNGVLAEGFMSGDRQIAQILGPTRSGNISKALQSLMELCETERFAEMAKARFMLGAETPIDPFMQAARKMAR